ncbi:response regulator transcription factor [Candidatus Falkowbacteria bacterium]|nr:response regulator transcription factor [Candidatus Falkowbacteria bacterium]
MTEQVKTILVIEDDPVLGVMYKTKLEAEGHKIILATNGADGLDAIKENSPDLVLLDIILPQLDGFSVLEDMKGSTKTKGIPVILLTNLGTEEDKKKGMELGASDYLVKADYTPEQISEKIEKFLK